MASAYRMVKEEGVSVHSAAKRHGVPRSTLKDRIDNRVSIDVTKSGHDPILNTEEEAMLCNHLKVLHAVGYCYTSAQVVNLASEYAVSLDKRTPDKPFSNKWYRSYKERWPEIKHDSKLTKSNKPLPTEEELLNYFRELGTLYTDNDLLDHPERIFTLNETKLDVVSTEPIGIFNENDKLNVTVIASGNALGNHVPPYYVFPGKEWDDELLQDAYTGTDGEMTEDGCSNSCVLHNYLTNHFANYIPLSQELGGYKTIILLDAHNSSRLLTIKHWADQNNVVLFVLPPRSKHLPRSIDVSIHKEFMKMYSLENKLNKEYNAAFVVTINNIAKFTARPYAETMSAEILASAFSESGIYPLNDKVITPS